MDPEAIESMREGLEAQESLVTSKKAEVEAYNEEQTRVSWMIQCEGCSEWFHGHCCGLDKDTAKSVDCFLCEVCSSIGWRHEARHWASRKYTKVILNNPINIDQSINQ